MRFKAYAKVCKFALALKVGGEADLPATDATSVGITSAVGMRQAAAKKRNKIAIANFAMAFTSEGTLGWSMGENCRLAGWPGAFDCRGNVTEIHACHKIRLLQMLNKSVDET
jgi:hypothetical protein